MTDHITAAQLRAWPTSDLVGHTVFCRAADALDEKDREIRRLRSEATKRDPDIRAKRWIASGMSECGRRALSDTRRSEGERDA